MGPGIAVIAAAALTVFVVGLPVPAAYPLRAASPG